MAKKKDDFVFDKIEDNRIFIKKNAKVYAGKEYLLVAGEVLPKEIDKSFLSSFRTEGIIE